MPLDATSTYSHVGEIIKVPVSQIILPPVDFRLLRRPEVIQAYAEVVEDLPPVEINQHFILIDGRYRYDAHRAAGATTLRVGMTITRDDRHILELCIQRNARHGTQLTRAEKRELARRLFRNTRWEDKANTQQDIAELLAVSARSVRDWVDGERCAMKSEINREVRELHDQHLSFEKIAATVGVSKSEAYRIVQCSKMEDLPKWDDAPSDDDDPWWSDYDSSPVEKDTWNFRGRGQEFEFPAAANTGIIEGLTYLYTKPGDMVVDPFAGSGGTLEVCQRRGRDCFLSDRLPAVERGNAIVKHNLNDGLPPINQQDWQRVSLAFMDPPYPNQMMNARSTDADDWANIPMQDVATYHDKLAKTINEFSQKMSAGTHIALLIRSSAVPVFVDHLAEILRRVDMRVAVRVTVPYGVNQLKFAQMRSMHGTKQVFISNRDLVVFEV